MKHEDLSACEAVKNLILRINEGEKISPEEEERLHAHFLICRDCRKLVNEAGEKVLYPEI
jgi:hypothetical protein